MTALSGIPETIISTECYRSIKINGLNNKITDYIVQHNSVVRKQNDMNHKDIFISRLYSQQINLWRLKYAVVYHLQ